MSRRRIIKPGKIWASDRRTTRRHFLFAPDKEGRIEQAFWYCLAVCANEFGVLIHAATLMTTHPHLVSTDVLGRDPDFRREFIRLFALSVKAIRGWPAEVFDKTKGGRDEPLTAEAVVDAIAYTIANPTTSFAVRYSRDWPGAKTLPKDVGRRVIRVRRPDSYFDPNNPRWPEWAELEMVMPELLIDTYGLEHAERLIEDRVRELEREALHKAKAEGIAFTGARRCTRVPHTTRARSYETFGSRNPRHKASGNREAAAKAIAELRDFNQKYDRAMTRWTSGDRRHAVFPHGTWWMRVHHGARCEPPP